MAIVLTIAGVPQLYRKGSLHITPQANGRATASFDIRSNDGTYRPAIDAAVVITEGGVTIFAGLIDRPGEQSVLQDAMGAYEAIVSSVSAVDYNHYAERRYVLKGGGFPDGYTLKQRLTSLLGYLTDYGVTLDAGQVDGPTFPESIYEYRQVADILSDMSTLTGKDGEPYVWNIDFNKVLSMWQPSTVAAPFDVTDGDGNTYGDITVQTSREKYANRIILRIPPKTELNRVEPFTGDGSTSAFALQYTPTKTYGVVVVDGVSETLTTTDYPGTATWELNTTTNEITRVAGAPATSAAITITFDGVFSGEATSEDAGEIASFGLFERLVTVETVPSDTTAQALADGYLSKAIITPKTIKYKTFSTGILPGMSQTITCAQRDLSAESCVISDVTIRDYGKGNRLVREVTATSGETTQDNMDVYKIWAGDKLGGNVQTSSPVTVGTGSVIGGAAPPVRSVQFNRSGTFGGNQAFIFYTDQASLICGNGGSSITAALFDSCYVLGNNCHITD